MVWGLLPAENVMITCDWLVCFYMHVRPPKWLWASEDHPTVRTEGMNDFKGSGGISGEGSPSRYLSQRDVNTATRQKMAASSEGYTPAEGQRGAGTMQDYSTNP